MSFFKDFKDDFTQAMNELMPDGNEMFEEDDVIEENLQTNHEKNEENEEKASQKKGKANHKPVKEKKSEKTKKKNEVLEQGDSDQLNPDRTDFIEEKQLEFDFAQLDAEDILQELEKEADILEEVDQKNEKNLEVKSETEQELENTVKKESEQTIETKENLVKKEKKKTKIKLVDEEEAKETAKNKKHLSVDTEIAESDIPVNENLLKTTSTNQEPELEIAPEDMSEKIDEMLDQELFSDGEDFDTEDNINTEELSVSDLLSKLTQKIEDVKHKDDEEVSNMGDDVMTDNEKENKVVNEDNTIEVLPKNNIIQPSTVSDPVTKEIEGKIDVIKNVVMKQKNEQFSQGINKEHKVSNGNSSDIVKKLKQAAKTSKENDEKIEKEKKEADHQTDVVEEDKKILDIVDGSKEKEVLESLGVSSIQDDENKEESSNEALVQDESIEDSEVKSDSNSDEIVNENHILEENMEDKKEIVSINSNDEEKDAVANQFNVEDADTETTYITKGTKIKGDIETDGSIDIIGHVEGNVVCKGKIVVGGIVNGTVTAGEIYANNAKIEGDVKSYGSVKVGVGSVIVGSIESESAVIAGAVNGDIDVQGPVIVDSTAVIMGNIKSRSVQINNGAVIEGFCSQSYSDIDVKSFFA